MKKIGWDLYFVTDSSITQTTIEEQVKAALAGGCKVIQYRDKNASTLKMLETAKWIKKLAGKKAKLLINDRVDVAVGAGVRPGMDEFSMSAAEESE